MQSIFHWPFLHIFPEGPVNINDGRRGRIAQQHINIHP
jgi:hypothetical protein